MFTIDRSRTYHWRAPMTSWQSMLEQDGLSYLQSIVAGERLVPPMAQTMDAKLVEVSDGYAVYGVLPQEFHYNPIGVVHGGLAATLFDSAMTSAIHSQLPAGQVSMTVELHVHYLRAMTMKTGRVRCEAKAIHVGRMMATAEAKLIGEDDGKLYGHASCTNLVMPTPTGALDLPETEATRTIEWPDPMEGAQKGMTMLGIDYMHGIASGEIPFPPIGALLGMTGIHKIEHGHVRFGGMIGGWQMNTSGLIHGGVAATICDSALGCAVHTTMPQGMAYTTTELNVNFVRPITLDVKQVYADATVIHSGNRIATAEARLVDDDGKLYAHATTTCLVFPMRS